MLQRDPLRFGGEQVRRELLAAAGMRAGVVDSVIFVGGGGVAPAGGVRVVAERIAYLASLRDRLVMIGAIRARLRLQDLLFSGHSDRRRHSQNSKNSPNHSPPACRAGPACWRGPSASMELVSWRVEEPS